MLIPLGLYHSDHLLTHQVGLQAVCSLDALPFLAYEDVPYRGIRGVLAERLSALRSNGIAATPARLTAASQGHPKRLAVQAYASQLRGLGDSSDTARPEAYWRLDSLPART